MTSISRKKLVKNKKISFFSKGKLVSGWRLLSEIGGGGNGKVWRVSKDSNSNYALKHLKSTGGTKSKIDYGRFCDEVKIVSSLALEGVIPIIDYYLPDNQNGAKAWYVMPYAISMDIAIDKISTLEKAKLFVSLGETLDVLHQKEIAHRDIKPQNILYYNNRLCFSDFGLVQYPEKSEFTVKNRDMGPKFTMAPEMRRDPDEASGIPADVYSIAKTLWISLTGVVKGFDGQYNSQSNISLSKYLDQLSFLPLDLLLSDCTDSDPKNRPTAKAFSERLSSWIRLNESFTLKRNAQWLDLQRSLFPFGIPEHADWRDSESILAVLKVLGRDSSAHHMFYPDGGGMDLTGATMAAEKGMIALLVGSDSIRAELIKPRKLTFENCSEYPTWSYFRLELDNVCPLNEAPTDTFREIFTELSPGIYVDYSCWEEGHCDGEELPDSSRPVGRYLGGSFVIFGRMSYYNQLKGKYDAYNAIHEEFSEIDFKQYISELATALGDMQDPDSLTLLDT